MGRGRSLRILLFVVTISLFVAAYYFGQWFWQFIYFFKTQIREQDTSSFSACTEITRMLSSVEELRPTVNPSNRTLLSEMIIAWRNFTPLAEHIELETDFVSWIRTHRAEWSEFASMRRNSPGFNERKRKMNRFGFVLNKHIVPAAGHVPIWLRVFRRTYPLEHVLTGLCMNDDIGTTQLIVTIDGAYFGPLVLSLIHWTQCMRVRIFWHTVEDTLEHMQFPRNHTERASTLNSHYLYGMHLLFAVFQYQYMATLEDDIYPGPDFYRFHLSLHERTLSDAQQVFAITPFPQGPQFDCRFRKSVLTGTGNCTMGHLDALIRETFFAGWGSGLPWMRYIELNSIIIEETRENQIYDFILLRLQKHSKQICISGCSSRINYIANLGVNGQGSPMWMNQFNLPHWNTPVQHRNYTIIN